MKSNKLISADGLLFEDPKEKEALRQGTPLVSRKGVDKKKSAANVSQDSSRNFESSVDLNQSQSKDKTKSS